MKELERRLRALETENDPASCLDCAMRRLSLDLGHVVEDGPCQHTSRDLAKSIVELDTALQEGEHAK